MDYILTMEDGSALRLTHSTLTQAELEKRKYAFPEKRKFPLPDRAHVMSAIRFFNYASPSEEKILANAILKRMRELGIEEVNVGPDNRFGKYYKPNVLAHHGVKGMKWGVWNAETAAKYHQVGNTGPMGGGGGDDDDEEKKGLSEQLLDAYYKNNEESGNILYPSEQDAEDLRESQQDPKEPTVMDHVLEGLGFAGKVVETAAIYMVGSRTVKAIERLAGDAFETGKSIVGDIINKVAPPEPQYIQGREEVYAREHEHKN